MRLYQLFLLSSISIVLSTKTVEMGNVLLELPIQMGYISPTSCTHKNCHDQEALSSLYAIEEAINVINDDPSLEYFHNLSISGVIGSNVLRSTVNGIVNTSYVALIGFPSDCSTQFAITSGYGKMGIADSCSIDLYSYGNYDTTVILFSPSARMISKVIPYLLNRYGWNTISLISSSDSSSSFNTHLSTTMNSYIRSNFDVRITTSLSSSLSRIQYLNQVNNDKMDARVFVISDMSTNAGVFFPYFLSMIENGLFLSGEYFVIAYLSFDSNRGWMSIENRNSMYMGRTSIPSSYNVTDEELMNAYRNLIVVSDSFPHDYANIQWENFRKNMKGKMKNKTNLYWDKSARDYDLMNVLSEAGMELLIKGIDITIGENYWEYMLQRNYTSVTGFPDFIDGMGMLTGSAQILYFSDSHNSIYNLWSQAVFHISEDESNSFVLTEYGGGLNINWINNQPSDIPQCGFKGEKCIKPKDKMIYIVIGCGTFLISALAIIAALLYRHYRREKKLHSLDFIIDRKNIILKRHVNILSERSLRSMASMGGSIVTSRAMKNSHFILEDYNNKEEKKDDRLPSISSSVGDDDQKWHEVEDFAVGLYNGELIGLKRIYKRDVQLNRSTRKEFGMLKRISHDNIIKFRGLITTSPDIFIMNELASRGSIKDILDNDQLPLEDLFLNQISIDICNGLEYLHNSEIGCHGRLKSSNCMIDARWVVKLSSFGLRYCRSDEIDTKDGIQEGKDQLWSSPEMIRINGWLAQSPSILVKKADIYSLAILLYEIFGRSGPWGDIAMEPNEILSRVRDYDESKGRKPFRPNMETLKEAHVAIKETVPVSWSENPLDRPPINMIKKKLKVLKSGLKKTIMDTMVAMVEKYTTKLEMDIAERNEDLLKERLKSEELLKMMLPASVADALKNGRSVTAESFDDVTILFSDCPGFTELSSSSEPIQIVTFLNDLYTLFDTIIGDYDVYKVETIADSYMCVSGLPVRNGNNHAGEIASMAIAMLDSVKDFEIRHRPGEKVRLRIGMNSGPCVAGVIGLKMPRYCLFGDTVNTASRMESNGIPIHINISQSTNDLLIRLGGYERKERGLVEMKGKGQQMTYFVTGQDMRVRSDRIQREKIKYPSLRYTVGSGEVRHTL